MRFTKGLGYGLVGAVLVANRAGISVPAAIWHLKRLEDAGLVGREKKGRKVHYYANGAEEGRGPDAYDPDDAVEVGRGPDAYDPDDAVEVA